METKCFHLLRRWWSSLINLIIQNQWTTTNHQVKSCPLVSVSAVANIIFPTGFHYYLFVIVVHIFHLSTFWKTCPALQSAPYPLAFPNHALHLSSLTPIYFRRSTLPPSVPFGWLHSHMSSDGQLHNLAPRPWTSKPHSKLLVEGRRPQQSPFNNAFLQQSSQCHHSCKQVDTQTHGRGHAAVYFKVQSVPF